MKYFSESKSELEINTLEIRTASDDREVFAIRRFFYHPLYVSDPVQYYYDLAILELGSKPRTYSIHVLQMCIGIFNS